MKSSARSDATKASPQWRWRRWSKNDLVLHPCAFNDHGEQSEPSLNRSEDFLEQASAPFLCEVPRFARDDTAIETWLFNSLTPTRARSKNSSREIPLRARSKSTLADRPFIAGRISEIFAPTSLKICSSGISSCAATR